MRAASSGFAMALLGACFCAVPATAANIVLPQGPNRDLVYGKCRTCHDLQYLEESAGISGRAWNDLLDSMRQYGLRLDEDTRSKVLEYLSTYLGPNPPPEAPAEETPVANVDGDQVFSDNCSGCHQPEGQGVAEQFPPLAGNTDLFADKTFPIFVVLHGLSGPIAVKGTTFDAEMPPFDHLSDAEIAAAINYVRSAWGNADIRPDGFEDVTAADVAAARPGEMDAEGVHALRADAVK